jgi:hypothetical protein
MALPLFVGTQGRRRLRICGAVPLAGVFFLRNAD